MRAFQRAQPRPRIQVAGVHRELAAEHLPALAGQVRPGDDGVAGGIADGRAAEVDYGTEMAILNQQVGYGDVAVDPNGRFLPTCGECVLPDGSGQIGVDLISQCFDRAAGLGVVG